LLVGDVALLLEDEAVAHLLALDVERHPAPPEAEPFIMRDEH
jgi:hypothetical protein